LRALSHVKREHADEKSSIYKGFCMEIRSMRRRWQGRWGAGWRWGRLALGLAVMA
jgi:hypothetical protein